MAQPWYTYDDMPKDLLGMLGQYGEQDKKEANRQALMALGFGLMGGRKGQEFSTLGRAGLGAMYTRNDAMANAQAQRQGQIQNAVAMMKMQQAQREQQQAEAQAAQQAQLSKRVQGVFSGAPTFDMSDAKGPTPENAATIRQPNLRDQYLQLAQLYTQAGKDKEAVQYLQEADRLRPKWNATPHTVIGPDGKPILVQTSETEQPRNLPHLPAIESKSEDIGGRIQYRNPLTNAITGQTDKTMSFADKNAAAQLRIAQSAEARAAAAAKGGGKPQWDSTTGQFVFAPTGPGDTGRAVTPAGYKPAVKAAPEAYSTQVAGIENLSSAMTDYKKKLKTWSNYDLTNPDARAEMSTAYTDMLMQAKEAYRLGVLNGPDYQLLTATITDPVSTRGALVSNKAMEKQIEQMQDKMEARKANLAKVYKQPQGNTGGATGGWSAVEIK